MANTWQAALILALLNIPGNSLDLGSKNWRFDNTQRNEYKLAPEIKQELKRDRRTGTELNEKVFDDQRAKNEISSRCFNLSVEETPPQLNDIPETR